MIIVTEQAKDFFWGIERPEGAVLRLDPLQVDQASGQVQIGLVAGKPIEGDQVVEHEGEDLLHIAGAVSEALDGGQYTRSIRPKGRR